MSTGGHLSQLPQRQWKILLLLLLQQQISLPLSDWVPSFARRRNFACAGEAWAMTWFQTCRPCPGSAEPRFWAGSAWICGKSTSRTGKSCRRSDSFGQLGWLWRKAWSTNPWRISQCSCQCRADGRAVLGCVLPSAERSECYAWRDREGLPCKFHAFRSLQLVQQRAKRRLLRCSVAKVLQLWNSSPAHSR